LGKDLTRGQREADNIAKKGGFLGGGGAGQEILIISQMGSKGM